MHLVQRGGGVISAFAARVVVAQLQGEVGVGEVGGEPITVPEIAGAAQGVQRLCAGKLGGFLREAGEGGTSVAGDARLDLAAAGVAGEGLQQDFDAGDDGRGGHREVEIGVALVLVIACGRGIDVIACERVVRVAPFIGRLADLGWMETAWRDWLEVDVYLDLVQLRQGAVVAGAARVVVGDHGDEVVVVELACRPVAAPVIVAGTGGVNDVRVGEADGLR